MNLLQSRSAHLQRSKLVLASIHEFYSSIVIGCPAYSRTQARWVRGSVIASNCDLRSFAPCRPGMLNPSGRIGITLLDFEHRLQIHFIFIFTGFRQCIEGVIGPATSPIGHLDLCSTSYEITSCNFANNSVCFLHPKFQERMLEFRGSTTVPSVSICGRMHRFSNTKRQGAQGDPFFGLNLFLRQQTPRGAWLFLVQILEIVLRHHEIIASLVSTIDCFPAKIQEIELRMLMSLEITI